MERQPVPAPEVYFFDVPIRQLHIVFFHMMRDLVVSGIGWFNAMSPNFLILLVLIFLVGVSWANDLAAPEQAENARAVLDEHIAKQEEESRKALRDYEARFKEQLEGPLMSLVEMANEIRKEKNDHDKRVIQRLGEDMKNDRQRALKESERDTLASIKATVERLEEQVANPPPPVPRPSTHEAMIKAIERLERKIDERPPPTPAAASDTSDAIQKQLTALTHLISSNACEPFSTPGFLALKQNLERIERKINEPSAPVYTPELAAIKKQVNSIEAMLINLPSTPLAPERAALQKQVQRLETKIDRAPAPITAADLAAIQRQLRDLERSFNQTPVPVAIPELATIQQAIEDLNHQIASSSAAPPASVLVALEEQIAGLHSKMDELPAPVPALDLAVFQEQVARIERAVYNPPAPVITPLNVSQQNLAFAEIKSTSTTPKAPRPAKLVLSPLTTKFTDPLAILHSTERELQKHKAEADELRVKCAELPAIVAKAAETERKLEITRTDLMKAREAKSKAESEWNKKETDWKESLKAKVAEAEQKLKIAENGRKEASESKTKAEADWKEDAQIFQTMITEMKKDGTFIEKYVGGSAVKDSVAEVEDCAPVTTDGPSKAEDNLAQAEESSSQIQESKSPEIEHEVVRVEEDSLGSENSKIPKDENNAVVIEENSLVVEGDYEDNFEDYDYGADNVADECDFDDDDLKAFMIESGQILPGDYEDEDGYQDYPEQFFPDVTAMPDTDRVTSSSGTGLSPSAFVFVPSSSTPNDNEQAQKTTNSVPAINDSNTNVMQTITDTNDNKQPAKPGEWCSICQENIDMPYKEHDDKFHGFCMRCKEMVRGEWNGDPEKFSYKDHKILCDRQSKSKPKAEKKTPATSQRTPASPSPSTPKPKAKGTSLLSSRWASSPASPSTPVEKKAEKKTLATPQIAPPPPSTSTPVPSKPKFDDKTPATKQIASQPPPSTSWADDEEVESHECRRCHELVDVKRVFVANQGAMLLDWNPHDAICPVRQAWTTILFHCGHCGVAVVNKVNFYQIHLKDCVKEAKTNGTLGAFDTETGELKEGRTAGPSTTKVQADALTGQGEPVVDPRPASNKEDGKAVTRSARSAQDFGSKVAAKTPATPSIPATSTGPRADIKTPTPQKSLMGSRYAPKTPMTPTAPGASMGPRSDIRTSTPVNTNATTNTPKTPSTPATPTTPGSGMQASRYASSAPAAPATSKTPTAPRTSTPASSARNSLQAPHHAPSAAANPTTSTTPAGPRNGASTSTPRSSMQASRYASSGPATTTTPTGPRVGTTPSTLQTSMQASRHAPSAPATPTASATPMTPRPSNPMSTPRNSLQQSRHASSAHAAPPAESAAENSWGANGGKVIKY